ncbi:MAG: YbaK/EbsC family protein [Chloroflexi bacterium]|nr:YbaK/EbsC family protein [Chloroflexota bacterium]
MLWYIPLMPFASAATQTLDLLSVPYRVFEHPHPPESLEQAAHERGQTPEQIIRSILFRYEKENFFLTLMAGPGQISWRKLRAHLGVSRISLATEDEVLAVTGYAVGTVSPLGLPRPIHILADISIFRPQEISLGSGVRGVAIILKSADLQRALGKIEVKQFC